MVNEKANAAAADVIKAFWALEEASGIVSKEGIGDFLDECFGDAICEDDVVSIITGIDKEERDAIAPDAFSI